MILIFIFLLTKPRPISNAILEGKQSLKPPINPIMVDMCSSSTHPTTTPSAFPTSIHHQLHENAQKRAPPLSWGMWAQIITQHIQKCGPHCICPSPFQRDVGGSRGGRWMGKRDIQAEAQVVGGPSGVSSKWTTMNIMVRFLPSSFILSSWPPLHPMPG